MCSEFKQNNVYSENLLVNTIIALNRLHRFLNIILICSGVYNILNVHNTRIPLNMYRFSFILTVQWNNDTEIYFNSRPITQFCQNIKIKNSVATNHLYKTHKLTVAINRNGLDICIVPLHTLIFQRFSSISRPLSQCFALQSPFHTLYSIYNLVHLWTVYIGTPLKLLKHN